MNHYAFGKRPRTTAWNAHTRVVTYDIADDKRRRLVAKTLEDYGARVQHSVFLCALPGTLFDRLWSELADIVDEEEDSVEAYFLCSRCCARGRNIGGVSDEANHRDLFVV